jgi:hypothetical protein
MAFIPIENLGPAVEHRMFGHAERLEASGGEVIPGRSEEYIIWQDERLIEKAQTYDEATRKGIRRTQYPVRQHGGVAFAGSR